MTRYITTTLLLLTAPMGLYIPARSGQRAEKLPAPVLAVPESSDDPTIDDFYPDHRAWQHGISLLIVNGRWLVVWSSWNNPPRPEINPNGNWSHDVFYSWLDPRSP